MTEQTPDEVPLGEPLTSDNLNSVAAAITLGTLAAAGLKQYGQSTFFVRPDGGVTFANPTHVHIHPDAMEDLGERPFRYVRPLIGDGRPQFVAWKDGILWEVSLSEEKSDGR